MTADETAYGNPQPYASPEVERHALLGRIGVARSIIANTEREDTRIRWARTLDVLLDHLAEVDVRAASAAMDAALKRDAS